MVTQIEDIRARLGAAKTILDEAQRMLGRIRHDDCKEHATIIGKTMSEVVMTVDEAKKSLKTALQELTLTDLALYLVVEVDGDDDPDDEAAA